MLKYMPPVPEPERKKKKKRKLGQEQSEQSGEGGEMIAEEKEDTEDSIALKDNLLICDDTYGQEVQKALSRMNEREIPLDIIEAKPFNNVKKILFIFSSVVAYGY